MQGPPSSHDGAPGDGDVGERRDAGLINLVVAISPAGGRSFTVRAEAKASLANQTWLVAELARRITQSSYALHGLRASIAARARLERLQFRRWVVHRDLRWSFRHPRPGLYRARAASRPSSLCRSRTRRSRPDFSVKSTGAAPICCSSRTSNPSSGTCRRRPWFEHRCRGDRREAAEQAIDSGKLSLTGPLCWCESERRGPGWLLFCPPIAPMSPWPL